jgi:hypothetical protein
MDDTNLALIREQIKKALIEGIRQADAGHFATKRPIVAYIGLSFFEGGETSIATVGSMNESVIFGAMEKTKFVIHDICLQAMIEGEANKIISQFEAMAEKEGLAPGEIQ